MKRNIFKACIFFCVIWVNPAFAEFGTIAQIIEGCGCVSKSNKSYVVRYGGGDSSYLYRGLTLYEGDRVVTKNNSIVVIRSIRGNIIVEPNSQLDCGQGGVFQTIGNAVYDLAGRFGVKTAFGNVSVKGTEFFVNVDSNGNMRVTTWEGSVYVQETYGNNSQMLSAGYQVDILNRQMGIQAKFSNRTRKYITEWVRIMGDRCPPSPCDWNDSFRQFWYTSEIFSQSSTDFLTVTINGQVNRVYILYTSGVGDYGYYTLSSQLQEAVFHVNPSTNVQVTVNGQKNEVYISEYVVDQVSLGEYGQMNEFYLYRE